MEIHNRDNQDILFMRGPHRDEPNEEPAPASEIRINTQGAGTVPSPGPVRQEPRQGVSGQITILGATPAPASATGAVPSGNHGSPITITPVSPSGVTPTPGGSPITIAPVSPSGTATTPGGSPITITSVPPSGAATTPGGSPITITPVSPSGAPPAPGGGSGNHPGNDPITPPAPDPEIPQRDAEVLLRQKEEELQTLRAQSETQENRIHELERQLQALRDTASDAIQDDDLEDKDSLIAELRGRVAELETQQANLGASAQAEAERDAALAAQLEAQETLAQFLAETPVVSLPALIPSAPLNVQQRELFQRYENYRARLEAEEQTSVVTEGYVRALTETLERHLAETERLRQQIAEAEQEKGEALQELNELQLQYQKDRHYVSFYEKLPEDKIDGLELFRVQLQELDDQLTETLKTGLVRAYVGRGTELEQQLAAAQEQLTAVLQELCELVESDIEPDSACFVEVYTAEEYKRRAKEQLARYEALLNEMNRVAELKLKFESIIGFGGEESF